MFRPGLFDGPVLYLDLDIMVVGSLDEVAIGHQFAMLKSFWPNSVVNSSVMAWVSDMRSVYERFSQKPHEYMNEYRVAGKWGDQDFIARHSPVEREYLQVACPGRFASYKLTMHAKPENPHRYSIIIFHGHPKPWDTPLWAAYVSELRSERLAS